MSKVMRSGSKKPSQKPQGRKKASAAKGSKPGISPTDVEDPNFEIDAEFQGASDSAEATQFVHDQGW